MQELTSDQKNQIKDFISAKEIKGVEEFDWVNRMIKYSSLISGKQIKEIKGDEEITRAVLISKLVNEYGYTPENLEIEREYTAGRPHTNTSIIDLIVRDDKGDAFLFIELKSPDAYASSDLDEIIKEQLFKVAAMEEAESRKVKYLALYTVSVTNSNIDDECIVIDYEKMHTFAEWEISRECTNAIPVKYGKAIKVPYIKGEAKDLKKDFTNDMLDALRNDLHNVLWGGGGTDDNDIFSSLTNLILAKIQDEDEKVNGDVYDFQSLSFVEDDSEYETLDTLFERVNGLYRRALREKLNITDIDEINKSYVVDTKKFSLEKVKYTVQKLEGMSFVDGKNSLSGKDILGDFFEGIIRDGFKQSKGQFFTHINIVRFMLWGIQADRLAIKRINEDREIPYMIDPSAGSGTFLIEYMKFITENIKYRFRDNLQTSRAVEDKCVEWFLPDYRENRWAREYIYGSELNFNLGTATKVNMILHGDGATNIFVGAQKGDGLLPFDKYVKASAPNALNKESDDLLYGYKVNGQFDLILTNPPFSVDLDNDTKRTIKRIFLYGEKKNSENLFIERYYQLLRENGRLAAVLPENVFDTSENKYIRLFIYKYFKVKAVVSLPQVSFEPYTKTKTSILFAQKKTADEVKKWDEAWNEASKEYAKLKTRTENIIDVYEGKKKKEKLPSIKDLTTEDERSILVRMLKDSIKEADRDETVDIIIEKYREELTDILSYDNDTVNSIGYVNSWWVLGEVAAKCNIDIFMAEADNVGYKRTTRGVKPMPNELYELEYAPTELIVNDVIQEYKNAIDSIDEKIKTTKDKISKEKKEASKKTLQAKLDKLIEEKNRSEQNYQFVIDFCAKYYSNNRLKSEYTERSDKELIDAFKTGLLVKYQSSKVALHVSEHRSILDYMRDISWE